MDAGRTLQEIIVALAVIASAVYVFRTRFPGTARRLRGWVAIRMVDSGSPRLEKWGRRLAPVPRAQDACGSCNSCEPKR
ncbi:hypothetical protein DWG18_07900 [Lysobacter sp. TY2-98]|uniref:DUF6587 family protein n=1 Tax=Lysobacter sp. TY2-98 TaxID=2290922 RepID=UPI000E1FD134|nr:DUF6587 family protein [Lysobacter sp. TY2-98]AXK72213.1 hypothetical protein DWG18_07900 [Lysobacter sp. TY2-98]